MSQQTQEILDTERRENSLKFMNRYVQKKQLLKIINKWKVKNQTKLSDMYNEILNAVQLNIISIEEFRSWLSKNQIDGNNYHFVYDVNFQNITEELLHNTIVNFEKISTKLFDVNEEILKTTKLIYAFRKKHKYVLSFIAPGQISQKVKKLDGTIRFENIDILYPAFVEFDFQNKNVIVVLNPTSNLLHVDGKQKGKYHSFSPIADLYLEKCRDILGSFYVEKPRWITEALYSLAEEVSYHNNPEIEDRSIKMQEKIKEFAKDTLEESDITDIALIDSFASTIQDDFILALQEEFGVIKADTKYQVYSQKTDQATTSIALESKGRFLDAGNAGKIAKQSRQDSDLVTLGLEVNFSDEKKYRFSIEDGKDHILIKTNNIFTEEEVVQEDVLSKLRQYKE